MVCLLELCIQIGVLFGDLSLLSSEFLSLLSKLVSLLGKLTTLCGSVPSVFIRVIFTGCTSFGIVSPLEESHKEK
jgi:hypothetical protein